MNRSPGDRSVCVDLRLPGGALRRKIGIRGSKYAMSAWSEELSFAAA